MKAPSMMGRRSSSSSSSGSRDRATRRRLAHEAATGNDRSSFWLASTASSSCGRTIKIKLSIPTGVCLNNKAFDKVDCSVLHRCVSMLGPQVKMKGICV